MNNRLEFTAETLEIPLLSLLALMPLTAMLMVLMVDNLKFAVRTSFAAALTTLVLSLYLLTTFDSAAEPCFAEHYTIAGFNYDAGLDSLNLSFLPLTAWLALIALVYQCRRNRPERSVIVALLAYEAILIGAFSALNVLQFWFFCVAEFMVALFLAVHGKSPDRQRTLVSILVSYWGSGLVLILVGLLLMAFGLIDSEHPLKFDWQTLKDNNAYLHDEQLIFILLLLGFAVRIPLFPFHGWLPWLLEHGSLTGIAFFFAGLKLGLYGVLRFILPLVPGVAELWAHFVLILAAAGILYGTLQALVQVNLRRLLAFAAVAHTGFLLIGLFSFNEEGLKGALLLAISFGPAAAALLYSSESIYTHAGTIYLNRLGGMLKTHTISAVVFFIAAGKWLIIPLIPPFQASYLLFSGIQQEYGWLTVILVGFGNLIMTGIWLKAGWQVFIAPAKRTRCLHEADGWERLVIILLGMVLLSADFYILKIMNPTEWSLSDIAQHYPMHGKPLL